MSKITKEQTEQLLNVANADITTASADYQRTLTKLTNLTPNIFFTDILDTINLEANPFDVFIKNDVLFGNGIRYVATGIINSQQYQFGKFTPSEIGVKNVPDFEDFSTSKIESTYPLVFNEVKMTDYFKSSNNLTTFINQIRAVNNLSYQSERLNSFLYLFGNNNVELEQYIKTELDKTKAKIVNTVDFGTLTDYKAFFVKLLELAISMGGTGQPLSNKYNIGFTNGQTTQSKYNKSNLKDDLVLIISKNDMLNLGKEAANIYHQNFYQGENKFYKIIECDIPAGTCYLLDKETLRLNPKIQKTTSNYWMDLSTTITSNIFGYWGIFKYGNGVKITYSITNK